MGAKSGLLLTGITHYPPVRSLRMFDIGGFGIAMSTRPFDIDQAAITVMQNRPFDILGSTRAVSTRPFDILGALIVKSVRPFDIVELIPTPVPGTVIPTSAVFATTLTANASAGDATVQVSSGSGIRVGSVVRIGGEIRVVTGIS